jgi:RimJ/RimL family protein N-acetyltransferase
MGNLTFVRFKREHYDLYATWSKDEEVNRWLGDADEEWLEHVLTTVYSFTWMIYEQDIPVANLQVDFMEDEPLEAQVTIMIAPQLRRQGYGQRVLTAMLRQAELRRVTRFYAFVKPENTASVELLKKMGYELVSPEPSNSGYVEYTFLRV